MSNFFTQIAAIIKPQLPSIVRRAMTAAGAALGTWGILPKDQTTQFVELGTSMVLLAIPEVWSWASNLIEQRKLVAAAKTGDPTAPPASKEETKVAMQIVQAASAPPPPPPPPPAVNLNIAIPQAAPIMLPAEPATPAPVAQGQGATIP